MAYTLCCVAKRIGKIMWIKKLFCLHYWTKPIMQKSRGNGMFGFIRQYEWKCAKCGKIKWSDYQDVAPEPNMVE